MPNAFRTKPLPSLPKATTMQLLGVLSLLAAVATASEYYAVVGSMCKINGKYMCTANGSDIAICDRGIWELAAKCGKTCCAPINDVPHCYC